MQKLLYALHSCSYDYTADMMTILSRQAIETVSQKLHLPFTNQQQNWAVDVADADRTREFIKLYWQDSTLDQPQKQALMALILASYDKALQEGESIDVDDWKRVQASLYTDPNNRDLLDYWALPGVEDADRHFHLTPYIRSPA